MEIEKARSCFSPKAEVKPSRHQSNADPLKSLLPSRSSRFGGSGSGGDGLSSSSSSSIISNHDDDDLSSFGLHPIRLGLGDAAGMTSPNDAASSAAAMSESLSSQLSFSFSNNNNNRDDDEWERHKYEKKKSPKVRNQTPHQSPLLPPRPTSTLTSPSTISSGTFESISPLRQSNNSNINSPKYD